MAWEKVSLNKLYELFYLNENESNINNLKEFLIDNNIVRKCERPFFTSVENFIKTGGDYGNIKVQEEPPYFDHGYYYKNKFGDVFCIYQPYESTEINEEVNAWAESRGLKTKIYNEEYGWFSSKSILVIIGQNIEGLIIKKAF